jgi:hypothetical protein
MTYKAWHFTVHALSRGASRLGLIVDRKVEADISNCLNSTAATLVRGPKKGVAMYEITVVGKRVVAVCDVTTRTIITFLNVKRFYGRDRKGHIRRKNVKADEQEDWDENCYDTLAK